MLPVDPDNLLIQSKPARRPREHLEVVRRQDHFDFGSSMHSEEQTWAVSYADFLMVLLSFFVIFFSVDNAKNKDSMVFKIMSQIKGNEAGSGKGTGTGRGPGDPQDQRFTKQDADKLAGLFKSFASVTSTNPTSLTIMFPDNIYRPGEYKMNREQKAEYFKLIEALKPYHGQVELIFTGHSDTVKVSKQEGKKYEDNFELSSLRASAAIRDAVFWGFPDKHIKAKASSYNERNTRSLSITIQDVE